MSENNTEVLLSTGEIAKECGVTVRTVQYYDKRGLLTPSELTDGGRRMYSAEDVKKLKLLCCLREIGLSIDNLVTLFKEENADKVLVTLLEERVKELENDIFDKRGKLKEAKGFLSQLRSKEYSSANKMQDIACHMKTKKELWKVRAVMIAAGLIVDAAEVLSLICWIKSGIWWPFAVCMTLSAIVIAFIVRFYYKNVEYICPECHEVFRPRFAEFFFASHTFNTRKLTCPACGKKSFCIETGKAGKEA